MFMRVFFRGFYVKRCLHSFVIKYPKNGYLINCLLSILDTIELTGGKPILNIRQIYKKADIITAVYEKVKGKIKGDNIIAWVIGLPSSPNDLNFKNV